MGGWLPAPARTIKPNLRGGGPRRRVLADERWTFPTGFPRSLAGLRCFEETIAPVKLVMYLDRSEDMLVQRLLERGRAGDDTWPEVVRKGVAAFLAEARPVLKHLEARATRAQMYCHVVGWGDDDQLALDMRLAVEEALKK